MKKILSVLLCALIIFALASCTVPGDAKNDNAPDFSYATLKGKTVVTVGAGGTPDVVFRHLLTLNGIEVNADDETSTEKVTIVYASDSTDASSKLKTGEADYAVLGEPAATTLSGKLGKDIVLDLQKEFTSAHEGTGFVQAGLFVTSSASSHSAYINALTEKLAENRDYVYENLTSLKEIFTTANSSLKGAPFTEELLNRCNIGMVRAGEVKNAVVEFLNTVKEFSAKQIGGKLPEDDFYYDFSVENDANYAKTSYKIGVVDGAPSLAVTNILGGFTFTDGETEITTSVELVGGADAIRSGLISGEYDMAIAPLNMASALYNAKAELGIKLLSVNIFGCLYMIG